MRIGRLKRITHKGLAWMLTVVCLLSYVERLGGGVIDAQAKEDTVTEYSEVIEEDNCILSLGSIQSAVIKSDGSLWTWGSNANGALGIGDVNGNNCSDSPVYVMDYTRYISVGGSASAAITTDNSLWLWGLTNLKDQSSYEEGTKPKKYMDDVQSVAISEYPAFAIIKEDESLWMWGQNTNGQLGDGTTTVCFEPIKIMDDVKAVSLGYTHSAAIKSDGSLWMWGLNNYGQLGNGFASSSKKPIKIMDDVKAVSLGNNHSAAIKADGSLWIWGQNTYGQLGNGTKGTEMYSSPIKIMDNVRAVSLGGYHSAAIKTDGSLWMWGQNSYGQLGNGTKGYETNSSTPIKIMDDVRAVSLGGYHSAAIKMDGSLWTWGSNRNGQLGNGTSYEEQSEVSEPMQIMPPGSISISGSNFEMTTEVQDKPRIRVLDAKGMPIAGAKVTHLGKEMETTESGYAFLSDYKIGEPINISKEGYKTLNTPYCKFKSGCTPYTLSEQMSGVTLTLDNEDFDILTEEVYINRYDKELFSIKCLLDDEEYETYMLYSGAKFVAACSSKGVFTELCSDQFIKGKPVYLKMLKNAMDTNDIIQKKLGIQVVDINPYVGELSLGEDISLIFPEDVPIVGGNNFQLHLGDSPVEGKITTDGKIQLGINVAELIKKDKDWFGTIKNLNKDTYNKIMSELASGESSGSPFDADVKVIGYLEGDLMPQGRVTGRIFVEVSAEGAWEQQGYVGPIPIVVEISVEGKLSADGSITLTMTEGFTGGALSVGGEFNVGVYGGLGIAKLASGGVYGKAGFGLGYNIFPEDDRGLDELYVQGEAGVKGKAFGKDIATWKLIEGKYVILPPDKRGLETNFAIDNDKTYTQLARNYLETDGTMSAWASGGQININGSLSETALQNSTCFDIVPQVVRMGDTVMLFYLTDAGTERTVANRSMLVYSLWDKANENWSEPKAVLDDGTADFAPDLYSDGEKIYAVWQNATENLTEGLTLNETAERLTLRVAVYDKTQDQFLDLGSIESENGLFQQSPQIVTDGDEVSVYWYENAEDNVLGLSGTNRIYRAVLEDAENAAQRATIQSVEDIEESEEDEKSPEEISEERGKESGKEEDPAEEDEPETEEPTVSGNDLDSASAFRKFVALEEETDRPEEEVTEPEIPEEEGTEKPDQEESVGSEEEPDQEVSDEETGESDQDAPAEETEESVSENTISENSISENTFQTTIYAIENRAILPWNINLVQTEEQCIISADAGKSNGKTGYAYAAGKLGDQFEISQGRVVFLAQDGTSLSVGEGETGSVAFTSVYSNKTLTWYQNGDIHYLSENGTEMALFEESRLPSSTYTLMSDGAGHPEVIFPVNMDGKSNLYRIGYENGAFQAALQVTDQEDYIQYADGFIDGGRTILVYNRMKVNNDTLEEINNSLCTGTLAHSYSDISLQSAGGMIRPEEESGENVLEITAQLYNNGTEKIENISLTLAKADGTALETVPVDSVLESGETVYVSADFAPEKITEEADYIVTVTAPKDSNTENNSAQIRLGVPSLQVNAQIISVADKRTMQVGIQNTGVTACGGIISVRDTETGKEYCNSDFEPIAIGQTVFAEIEINPSVFGQKDVVVLEAVVIPDAEDLESVSDFVTAYAPTYAVSFVADTEESTVYAGYGKTVEFPANPAKDGAHFAGWYDTQNAAGGTLYTEETPIRSDVTLYARFVQEQTSIPLENCSVAEIPTQLYTGKALKPAVTVKWGSEVLKANKDYTLSYQNNKEQGTAKVTISGKGKYTGSITRSFLIKYAMNKVSVSKIPAVNFTGENHTPDMTVTYNKKTLVKGTDYTVTYTNNRNAGTAGITLTGKGKYSGTKTVTFQIKGTAITGMVFDKIPDVPYNGSATRPIVTVKTKDGTLLMPGADYRLSYENTVNKGKATVTVIGNGNYTGTKKLTYKVVAKPLTEAMISGIEDAVYTGSPIKPAVTVKDGGTELAAGKDYTVSYSKKKTIGTATVTVKGKGNYGGTVKLPFEIQKCSLEDNAQISVQVSDIAYTGKAVKPKVQVYEGSRKLPAGGYTLFYANNIEMGTGTVTITGKGSYTGTVTAQFRIVEKAKLITSLKIGKIADTVYTGTAIEPEVTVTDGVYTLVKGTDYELSYKNQYNAGKATVTVKGIGSYAGSKDVTYKIGKRTVGNKTVLGEGFEIGQISDEKYTGYALKPDVVVKDQGKTLVLGTDYKLSYRNNTKIGTASVTLTGIGNYSGSYNAIRFNIVSWDYNDLQAQIEDQVYTGKALKPQVTFYTGGEAIALKPNTAVKIVYKDNKNAGMATATITGKGELKSMNPITVSFEIESADITDAVVGRIPNQTLKGVAVKPIPKVKVGRNSLKAERDFKVSYLRNGVKGEAQVIITGIGNYTGECRKSFIVQ